MIIYSYREKCFDNPDRDEPFYRYFMTNGSKTVSSDFLDPEPGGFQTWWIPDLSRTGNFWIVADEGTAIKWLETPYTPKQKAEWTRTEV